MQRKTLTLSATENIDFGLTGGNAVLVQLEGTGFTGTVDLQSSIDGITYGNHPYVEHHSVTAQDSVAQITDPSTVTSYLMWPPVTQARIKVTVSAGSLKVTFREI